MTPWWRRLLMGLFAVALLYPFSGFFASIGPWRWTPEVRNPSLASIRVSLLLTGLAMIVVILAGTPVALYIRRASSRERLLWQAALLLSILVPPLALGILLSLAFRPDGAVGGLLAYYGIFMTNSPLAFVTTQAYVGIGYYVLGAVSAFDAVPDTLEKQAALLGLRPWQVFLKITLPLSRLALAVALSMAWVRAIGEFGAVMVTAYYPAGMPVQLWIELQSSGLPAAMPLLAVFLLAALPLPWVIHLLAQRQQRA